MLPEEKLMRLGFGLPTVPAPAFNYVPFKRDGNTVYISGQGPLKAGGGGYHLGKVGDDVTTEQAVEHAKLTGHLGDRQKAKPG
ncbi:MAG: RidA family protein, partial [Pseudomonadota bacterium]